MSSPHSCLQISRRWMVFLPASLKYGLLCLSLPEKMIGKQIIPLSIIQLPPSIKTPLHSKLVEDLLARLDPRLRHAIELRHRSWFDTPTYKLLSRRGVAMVWSVNMYIDSPPEITSDFIYLRLIGDRTLTSFSRVQKDRTRELEKWAWNVRRMSDGFERGYCFSNNHFAGFAAETISTFRR